MIIRFANPHWQCAALLALGIANTAHDRWANSHPLERNDMFGKIALKGEDSYFHHS